MSRIKGKPKSGYDFGNKKHYRRTLWNFIDNALRFKKPIRDRKVLIIDTSEAIETLFLVERGYKPENLTVVNRNPAELAWLTRRLRNDHAITGVRTIADDAFEVADDKFDVLNLDLTGPISTRLMERLKALEVKSESVIAVSILRGRESDAGFRQIYRWLEKLENEPDDDADLTQQGAALMRSFLLGHHRCDFSDDGPSDQDFIRVFSLIPPLKIQESINIHLLDFAWGRYASTAGSQTMLWVARHLFPSCEIEDLSRRSLAEISTKRKLILDMMAFREQFRGWVLDCRERA